MARGSRTTQRRRVHGAPLVWGASALAAVALTLASTGTLSSWTQAIINNDTNTVATAQAVILKEANGATTCFSSSSATNSSTCSTINKYGGTASPLLPGAPAQVTTVTFTNIGARNGTSFVLAPGTCTQNPVAGAGPPAVNNVCTNGDLTVDIKCSPGATFVSGSAWSDLNYAAAAPPTATKTHTATAGDLNASASWTCQISVALIASAAVADQGITVSQPLVWTLNG
jgi:hypothetical protein